MSPAWRIVPYNLEESFHWPAGHLHLLFHWPVFGCQGVSVLEISPISFAHRHCNRLLWSKPIMWTTIPQCGNAPQRLFTGQTGFVVLPRLMSTAGVSGESGAVKLPRCIHCIPGYDWHACVTSAVRGWRIGRRSSAGRRAPLVLFFPVGVHKMRSCAIGLVPAMHGKETQGLAQNAAPSTRSEQRTGAPVVDVCPFTLF